MTNRFLKKLASMAFSDAMVGESIPDSVKKKAVSSYGGIHYDGIVVDELAELCKTVCKKYQYNIENGHTKNAGNKLMKVIADNPGKFNIDKLKNEGFIRSKGVYAAGLRKGTENIAALYNTPIKEIRYLKDPEGYMGTLGFGGHSTKAGFDPDFQTEIRHLGTGIMSRAMLPQHKIFTSRDSTRLKHELGNRHEAHEVMELTQSILPDTLLHNKPFKNRMVTEKGHHATAAVLMRDSNATREIPYEEARKRFDMRRASGENEIIRSISGKDMGDKFNPKDIKKGRKFSTDE